MKGIMQVLDYETTLDYEIRCSKRYRRFVSVIMLSAMNETIIRDLLSDKSIRSSDEIFLLEDKTVIIMGETDISGALTACNRIVKTIKKFFNDDIRSGIASFPVDGFSANDLLITVNRRFEKAQKMLTNNAIVING